LEREDRGAFFESFNTTSNATDPGKIVQQPSRLFFSPKVSSVRITFTFTVNPAYTDSRVRLRVDALGLLVSLTALSGIVALFAMLFRYVEHYFFRNGGAFRQCSRYWRQKKLTPPPTAFETLSLTLAETSNHLNCNLEELNKKFDQLEGEIIELRGGPAYRYRREVLPNQHLEPSTNGGAYEPNSTLPLLVSPRNISPGRDWHRQTTLGISPNGDHSTVNPIYGSGTVIRRQKMSNFFGSIRVSHF